MRSLLLALAATTAIACTKSVHPLALAITIQPNRTTAATGYTITFTTEVQGGQIVNVTIHFGDGEEDFYNTNYARTATLQFRHAYAAPGTFDVDAVVLDAVAGAKADTVQVVVN